MISVGENVWDITKFPAYTERHKTFSDSHIKFMTQ
jgi:hypothetical protein